MFAGVTELKSESHGSLLSVAAVFTSAQIIRNISSIVHAAGDLRFLARMSPVSRGIESSSGCKESQNRRLRTIGSRLGRSKLIAFDLREAAAEVILLDAVGGEGEGAAVGFRGFAAAVEAAENVGAGGVEEVVAVELAGGAKGVN